MVRRRRINGATRGTSERGGEGIQRTISRSEEPGYPEIPSKPAQEIQIIPEDSEEMAVREGIHERIQAEIHQGNKEEEARAEEMLEVPPEWNEVPDLMMEEEDVLPEATGSTKRRRDEISRGRRKRRKEDDIRQDEGRHSPTLCRRIQNPEGLDCDEVQ